MNLEFSSLSELYDRIKPALETKAVEMHRVGYSYIKKEDIWNYLKEIKWKKACDLSLHEMINDILNTDNTLIDTYFKDKVKDTERIPNLEEV